MSVSEDIHGRADAVFRIEDLDAELVSVISYELTEGLSQLFEIEILLAVDSDLPLDESSVRDLLESPCAFAVGHTEVLGEPYFGVLREWELIEATPGHQTVYRAVMVPSVYYLTQTHRSRVFQELSVPEIVQKVLEEAGFASGETFELALSGSYPVREYVVQYEESDLDFLARLCEHEGIFFFFDHADLTDKIVFGDSKHAFKPAEPSSIPYQPRGASKAEDACFTQVRRVHRVLPGQVVLRDSNYRTPLVPLQATAEIHPRGLGVVALYGDHFPDVDQGGRLAKLRAEERALDASSVTATGMVPSLRCGQTFTLEDHPLDELSGKTYVVTAQSRRSGAEGGTLEQFQLLPTDIPYRPARVTRRPRIYGLMHARIDGESEGTPAPIDGEGRYKVLLPFDGVGEVGGAATRWIRRMQVYAGPAYGMHFPLHIGTEVLLAHLDGDPDRPVIVGAVPNPATASPVIADLATKSIVRTKANIVTEWEDDA